MDSEKSSEEKNRVSTFQLYLNKVLYFNSTCIFCLSIKKVFEKVPTKQFLNYNGDYHTTTH